MSKPSLVNILRNTLQQVEEKVEASEDELAVSELRKQIALTVAEVELIKEGRSAVTESEPRLFVVSRRRREPAKDDSVVPIEKHRKGVRSRQK
jgi:hypothetical protein